MSSDAVRLEIDDGIATVTLNQPDQRNAFTPALKDAFPLVLDEIESNVDTRCVVFEGAGQSFSAGGDITQMRESIRSETPPDDRAREIEQGMGLIGRIARFPYYTIAKIQGPAVGAGAALAIASDLQVMSSESVIGFVFRQVGLAADNGVSYLLPRVVGSNVAKELLGTGRLVGATEAQELGLVNHVYDEAEFEDQASDYIREIATGPTVALRHSKHLVDNAFDVSLARALKDEAIAQSVVMQTADHVEGVEAFLEKRDPVFEGQ